MELWEKSETVDSEVRAYVYSLVNAVGGRSTYDDTYAIGDDALATLKDIRRWLLLYDEKTNRLDVKRCLAESNLVKGDLLEILALWNDDAPESGHRSKLALACLELLVPLTWPVQLEEERTTVNTHRHLPYLQLAQVGYKRAILHHDSDEILRKIVRVALPSIATPRMERSKRDEGVIMLVLYLLRHVAMITQPQNLPSQGDENDISRNAVIEAFDAQDIFSLLLTIGSTVGDDFQEHDVEVLEILYHLLKGIDPTRLFTMKEQVVNTEMKEFQQLLSKEKAMLSSYSKTAPTRHNRFGTTIWVKRDDKKLSTVSGQNSITNTSTTLHQMDLSKKWDKPKYRGRLVHQFDEQSDFGMRIELADVTRARLRSFVEDVLDSTFNPLFSSLRKAIEREQERVKPSNIKQYFYLVNWFLSADAARHNHGMSAHNTPEDNQFAYIAAVLDQETFVLLNRTMQRATDEKDWQTLQATILAFTQILLTVQRMAESKNEDDQEIAENIQNRIFYEESTHDRIASVLRGYTHQGFAYLDAVTECVHVFVRMLERYSKQNADLQIRSKRRARRKAKQVNSADADGGNEDGEEAAEEEREVHRSVNERKFDFTRFVSKFLSQQCVNTFVVLLHYYADMSSEQLKRCHRYFYRLAFKSDLAILLFRVDILQLFRRLIKGPEGLDPKMAIYADWEMLVRQVFRKCIRWLSKPTESEGWMEMCVVEMLFSKIPNSLFYLQNGYERVVEKRAPRPPAELEIKASVDESQRIAVAVGALVDKAKGDHLKWVKEQLAIGVEERKAWEEAEVARKGMQAESESEQTESQEAPAAPSILLHVDSEERKLALFKDKYLRLLLSTLNLQRLGLAEEADAPWIIPSGISAAQLSEALDQIQRAEFDAPTFEDGKSAAEMIRNKSSARPSAAKQLDVNDLGEDDSDASNQEDDQKFPANLREKRKRNADDAAPEKRRRLNRRAPEDESLSDIERKAEDRRARERERNAKIKSKLFVTESDDESDAEGDAEFYRLEEQRRLQTKGVIQKALLEQQDKDKQNAKGGKKKNGKKTGNKVEANVGSEDDVVSDVDLDLDLALDMHMDMDMDSDEPERLPGTYVFGFEKSSSGGSSEDESAEAGTTPSTSPLKEVSGNINGAGTRGKVVVDDGEDDGDDVAVVKQAPRRAVRAGFILDESDSD